MTKFNCVYHVDSKVKLEQCVGKWLNHFIKLYSERNKNQVERRTENVAVQQRESAHRAKRSGTKSRCGSGHFLMCGHRSQRNRLLPCVHLTKNQMRSWAEEDHLRNTYAHSMGHLLRFHSLLKPLQTAHCTLVIWQTKREISEHCREFAAQYDVDEKRGILVLQLHHGL